MGLMDEMYMLNEFHKKGLGGYQKTIEEIEKISDIRKTLTEKGYISWEPIVSGSNQYLPQPTTKRRLLLPLTLLAI
ncbi:hypothetical protein J4226_01305 [Candidatus Pacearchaeota archaeon]|nr:hypothetical protein [Candidatus Pacearchaeota archaeon]